MECGRERLLNLVNVVFISSEISCRYQYLQLGGIINIPDTNHRSFSSLPANLEVNSLKNKQLHSHVSTLEINTLITGCIMGLIAGFWEIIEIVWE